ncbi:putative small lipoprotein YifL [Pedobacter sp. AK017]|uniref:DUF4625 domain-containing protein n=1 Tax=Pedobacter sp. AK017 TaxID=2723073 RepID=UPI0017A2194D|nr:DUF4625 domain-containing protein [Pedobacter sp. AK017]MBB5438848.1 putative small lipoprotein YifL [Pedobacter sp. AK017]
MKKVFNNLTALIMVMIGIAACSKPLMFPEAEPTAVPQVKQAVAQLLWIGPEYKLVVQATLQDADGISKVKLKNGEWGLDAEVTADNKTSYTVNQTFVVSKDVNVTEHNVELTITNSKGGIAKAKVKVEDLSAQNQIPGYTPDLLPPVITVTKPTITRFYGLANDPINIDVAAGITDAIGIAAIEVKVWGETASGELVNKEELISPVAGQQNSYAYSKTFALPAGKVGEYQYLIKATDASGNKSIKSGVITVGYMDRLYLSDAENMAEVTNQGYDNGGNARGIGTLLSMKKQGANSFVVDYYYRNEASDNIRFIAFLGNDRPFTATTQAAALYTLDGTNVLGNSATATGKVTPVLAEANFKLPVTQKGYYRITVDMTARSITAVPFTPSKPFVDATKYPGWAANKPYAYLAVISSVVDGTAGWAEVATSPKLMKEANHNFLYTGTFKTTGNSVNLNFTAPKEFVNSTNGWFRLLSARANMKDDYGDPIDIVSAVGLISAGTNYGFSHNTAGTFKATYDMALERLRLIRTGN